MYILLPPELHIANVIVIPAGSMQILAPTTVNPVTRRTLLQAQQDFMHMSWAGFCRNWLLFFYSIGLPQDTAL
jgi:hypothetical protein